MDVCFRKSTLPFRSLRKRTLIELVLFYSLSELASGRIDAFCKRTTFLFIRLYNSTAKPQNSNIRCLSNIKFDITRCKTKQTKVKFNYYISIRFDAIFRNFYVKIHLSQTTLPFFDDVLDAYLMKMTVICLYYARSGNYARVFLLCIL